MAKNFRFAQDDNAGDVWGAGTLEWLPNGNYQTRSLPVVKSHYPLWDQPNLARDVEDGRFYLPGTVTGERETLVTSPLDGTPQYLLVLPRTGWQPVLGAVFTAGFFLLLTGKMMILASICAVLAFAFILWWLWQLDPGPMRPPVDVGGGVVVPLNATGPVNHSWWAMIILMVVLGMIFICLIFSYLFLWLVNPGAWPPAALRITQPGGLWPLATAALLGATGAALFMANRLVGRSGAASRRALPLLLGLTVPLGLGAGVVDLFAHLGSGLRPEDHAYGAAVYTIVGLQLTLAGTAALMSLFTVARWLAGYITSERRSTFDNTLLMWLYVIGQGLVALLLVHGFPRLAGSG
jgi:cytochrome c oxidase subunit I+III